MSLLISITHPEAIIMASDTKIITMVQEHKVIKGVLVPQGKKKPESSQQQKTFAIHGIGALSFWGEATNTPAQIIRFLRYLIIGSDDINSVADKLFIYLKDEIKPDAEIGFHLGGYDKDKARRLYHIFYGIQIGEEHKGMAYYKNLEDDGAKPLILFNGKNRYTAEIMMLFKELEKHRYLTLPSSHSIDENMKFAHALINHTARIIRDYEEIQSVGGSVNIFVIYPDNKIETAKKFCGGELESYLKGSGDSIHTGSGVYSYGYFNSNDLIPERQGG